MTHVRVGVSLALKVGSWVGLPCYSVEKKLYAIVILALSSLSPKSQAYLMDKMLRQKLSEVRLWW